MTKSFSGIVVMLLILLAACSLDNQEPIRIIPQPTAIEQQPGQFEITKSTKLYVSEPSLTSIAKVLSNKINTVSHFELLIDAEATDKNCISFVLNDSIKNNEGYLLEVNKNKIVITGKSQTAVYYGLQTLLQLLPAQVESPKFVQHMKWKVPFVKIKDEPRFKWRGLHLDVCRHFVSVENIKKHLDMMAMLKLNTFHWHLTEDQGWRIEIKQYPKLTEIGSKRIEGEGTEYGGFYTQEEIKEIVNYATERHIQVVPEIELPGHALAALTAYPEYSCTGGSFKVRNIWGVEPDVYCAGKEETFAFLENIIDEVVELFPSTYFHIGGDECPKDRWKTCKLCQKRIRTEGLKDEHELQSYFIQRIEKILLNHGKKMIGWDEILEGGLAESAAVMSWRGEQGGIDAASQGHDVVMTPGNWCYLDHYQGDSRVEPVAIGGYTTLEETYSYEPLPEKLSKDKAHHVLGTQGNVWTEYMYTNDLVEYRVYPRLVALAEVNWTTKENKNYESFVDRLDNLNQRMDLHNINYHIPLPEGPVNKMVFIDNIKLEFHNTRNLPMVYTTDGSKPTVSSNVYQHPLIFAENKTINISTLTKNGKISPVRTINVVKTEYIDPVSVEVKDSGLIEKTVEGNFLNTNELNKINNWTTQTNSMKSLNISTKDSYNDGYAAILEGYMEIPADGIYEFATNLDQLYLAGQLLIDNNGEVKRYSRNNTTIALRKGKHPVKLVYLNNIIGGWPQSWNGLKLSFRLWGDEKFTTANASMFTH